VNDTVKNNTAEEILAGIRADQMRRREAANAPSLMAGDYAFVVREAAKETEKAEAAKEDRTKPAEVVPLKAADVPVKRRKKIQDQVLFEKTQAALVDMGIHFAYDVFHIIYHAGNHELHRQYGTSLDNICLALRHMILQRYRLETKLEIENAVRLLCLKNSFHPVRDYLDALRWDGTPRIDTWLSRYLGAEDNPLNRVFGRKVLIAAVRRVREPGCKFDQMLVLEGPEGTGKSSAVKILAGGDDFFSDATILDKDGKELQELTCGVWLYEVSELAGLNKREVEHVKALLSRTHDKARGAYGRIPENRPRQCIFIGTTNQDDYLTSTTGNRRIWPVATTTIDLEGLERDRDQLWAEANLVEASGQVLTLDGGLTSEAAARTESRLAADPWEDTLEKVWTMSDAVGSISRKHGGEQRVSSEFLLTGVLYVNPANARNHEAKRLANCMRRLGWTGPKVLNIDGKDMKGYARQLGERERVG
jgi:predicted P-loop ATPase